MGCSDRMGSSENNYHFYYLGGLHLIVDGVRWSRGRREWSRTLASEVERKETVMNLCCKAQIYSQFEVPKLAGMRSD